jgi:hypothetical protein
MISRRTLIASTAAAALLGGGLALAVPASAGTYPTPTPATPTPTVTVTPPVVNPFAHCRFTHTLETTFDPAVGRFAFTRDPSITCVNPLTGALSVYLLARPY